MSQIRGEWTWQERVVHNHLKGKKIRHKMHPQVKGNPDIILKEKKVAIFLDGCFWHGCPQCYQKPETNKEFWQKKISKNIENAIKFTKNLEDDGWKVIRIWEHEIRKEPMDKIIHRILS